MPYTQFSSKAIAPRLLNSPILVDKSGIPRYWATVWVAITATGLAESTEMKRLRHIESLYSFCDESHGDGFLDDVLGGLRIEELGEALEAYFLCLKNRSVLTNASELQWQSVLAFIKDTIYRLSKNGNAMEMFMDVESRIIRFQTLYGQLQVKKTRVPEILRSLPASVVSYLYDTLDPESPSNPFIRTKTRWVVYQAFILMLHQGMRVGEVLLLPVNALNSSYDERALKSRYWINIRKDDGMAMEDSRRKRPSIKTADSNRQIPVSELTSKIIQTYTENYRGKPNHRFLLNSQWNTALSHDSVTAYFAKLSSKLPTSILRTLEERTGKKTITPHDLRHTCAVVRLNQLLAQNTPFDLALQQLRGFFGWSRTSDMPKRYARAVFEDRLSNVWSNIMDDRIEILRSIPRGH